MSLPSYFTTDNPLFWVAISVIVLLCICLGISCRHAVRQACCPPREELDDPLLENII
jgi:hypothetical protein